MKYIGLLIYALGYILVLVTILVVTFRMLSRRAKRTDRPFVNRTRCSIAIALMLAPIAAHLFHVEFIDPARQRHFWEIAGLAFIYLMFAITGLASRNMAITFSTLMYLAFAVMLVFGPFVHFLLAIDRSAPFTTIASKGKFICDTRGIGLAINGELFEVRVHEPIGLGMQWVRYDNTASAAEDSTPSEEAQCSAELAQVH